MTTTDLLTSSLLGRARTASMTVGVHAAHATDRVAAAPAELSAAPTRAMAYVAPTRTTATNPWLGGFGFGGGTGICPTTAIGEFTKRNHPGRLEGVT